MAAVVAAAMAWLAADAGAQSGGDPDYRFFVHLDGAYQRGSAEKLQAGATFAEYDEMGRVDVDYDAERSGGLFRVTVGGLFSRYVGLALGYSRAAGQLTGTLTVQRPHPLFYNRPRTQTSSPDLSYMTHMAHIMVVGRVPLAERWELLVTGGPSGMLLRHEYPRVGAEALQPERGLDPAQWEQANANVATDTTRLGGLGFNGGADVTYRLHRNVGVGAFVGYAGGSLNLRLADTEVSVKLGGMQVGGGLRLRF